MHIIEITDFMDLKKKIPVIDVRSEGEFEQGRIPLATNVPLLNNEERKKVGICYKENGNEAAVL